MDSLKAAGTQASHAQGIYRRSGILTEDSTFAPSGSTSLEIDENFAGDGDAIEILDRNPFRQPYRGFDEEPAPVLPGQETSPRETDSQKKSGHTGAPSAAKALQTGNTIYTNANGTLTVIDNKEEPAQAARETVNDRRAHIEPGVVREIPRVPPHCDGIQGLKKGYIETNGTKLYYEEEGKGTPIVVLHGGPGGTHHDFHPQFSELAKSGRVIYYDQRGTGKSGTNASGEPYSVKQAVDDLEGLRKSLGLEKMVVVGHSYGGFLAQCYALEHPDRVQGLALVTAESGMPNNRPGPSRDRDFFSEEEKQKISSLYNDKSLTEEQGLYNRMLNGDWKRQNYYKPTEEEMARNALYGWKPAPGFRCDMGNSIDKLDLEGKFKGLGIPTLIMESAHDLTWGADKPEKIHRNHPGSPMVMFEKSGHSPFRDEPEKFFSALSGFVRRTEENPREISGQSRMEWPPESVAMIDSLQMAKPEELSQAQVMQLFRESKEKKVPYPDTWRKLGQLLYHTKNYNESLESWKQAGSLPLRPSDECWSRHSQFTCRVWQGHLYDLTGDREKALASYNDALKVPLGENDAACQDSVGLILNRQWVRERLNTPFEHGMRNYFPEERN